MRAKELVASYPAELPDNKAIADYIESTSTSFVDTDRIMDEYIGCRAVLKTLPVSSLAHGRADGNIEVRKNQTKYNKINVSKQPPIVVDGGFVVDGNHRLRAAIKNKQNSIQAYVII